MDALRNVVLEIESHVAAAGWDQPLRLFALVPTRELVANEPQLAALLLTEGARPDADALTPVEQEELPDHASVEELLAGLSWPPGVAGAAVSVERLMLPPEAEADLPDEESAALDAVARHPARQEVRLAVGVLRDGSRHSAVRLRDHDDPDDVLTGPDLVPGLADALASTFEP
jgi:hypothetical protein